MPYPSTKPASQSGRTIFPPGINRLRNISGPETVAEFYPNPQISGAFFTALTAFLAVIFAILSSLTGAHAQGGQPGIMANGDLAVTGFSGTRQLGAQTFIDTNGVSLKVFDVSGRGNAASQVISAPVKFEAFARDTGQVFGVALDNAPQPNIYTTATSAFGLQIVIPDNNGDGVPERVTAGQPGATFMDGQFGTALGGGPGSVWRIDGTTGEVKLFADIKLAGMPNSGPGLGNIAFDPAHYQFYVSDLDTGLVHRLDLSGNDLGTFDHGVQGRPAAGLPQIVMNIADRMDITSPAFNSTDSTTWHLADIKRRVWGLAYYSGRLYYGVGDGPQIWSVGITANGGFANDARVEIQSVPGGKPVSDILFTPRGKMVLSQRGGLMGSQDYTKFHTPKDNAVLRYSRDVTGNWVQVPDEYAIGFPADHKNASGGVALSCNGTLWSTGDALRNDPAQTASLAPGGPLVVHGLQGNKMSLIRPFNTPPRASWFVDYDSQFADPEKAGHAGDVEVYRNCSGGHAESFPGWYPIPEWYPPEGWHPPHWWPETPDLDLEKIGNKCVAVPGLVPTYQCKYTIAVTNVGAADYVGQIHVDDNPPATAVYVPPPGGSIPWNCAQPGGAGTPISCDSTNVEVLHPGETETLDLTIQVTPGNANNHVRNCAIVDDPILGNNKDCGEADLPRSDLKMEKTFLGCLPEGANKRCLFVISFENVGGAAYTGPLHFVENIPAGTIFGGIFGSTTPGWGCVGGLPVNCTLPNPPGVTMNPGDVEQVGISVIVPAGVGGNMNNCVALGLPEHAGDPVLPGVNNACAPFSVALPIVHKCPAGWSEVPPGGAPAGWQVIAIDGINPDGTGWGIMCMKPQPLPIAPKPILHKCPAGWTKVPPQGAPAGYQVLAIDGVNPDGSKWGMMCMKPRVVTVLPFCKKGETKYQNAGQVPKGWSRRKVTLGKHSIYCAKPRVYVPVKPLCKGGRLLMLKTMPPRYICKCPKGWSNVRGTCKRPVIQTPPPRITPCLRGWSRVNGVCKPPRLSVPPRLKLCKKGWSRVNGVCKPPRIQINPSPAPKRKLKPVTRYTPPMRLKQKAPSRLYR